MAASPTSSSINPTTGGSSGIYSISSTYCFIDLADCGALVALVDLGAYVACSFECRQIPTI